VLSVDRALAGLRCFLGTSKSFHIVREGMQCHKVLQNPFVRGLTFKGHRVHRQVVSCPKETSHHESSESSRTIRPVVTSSLFF